MQDAGDLDELNEYGQELEDCIDELKRSIAAASKSTGEVKTNVCAKI